MNKHAEDLLAEKELDYWRGFLDCALLLNDEFQVIPHAIPAPKPFDYLASRIEELFSIAVTEYEDRLKAQLWILWKKDDYKDLKEEVLMEAP